MLLTELTDLIVEQLNDKQSLWKPPGLVVKAIPTIDWVGAIYETGFKVLVVPELIQYNIGEDNTREKVKTLSKIKYISVLVGKTFTSKTDINQAATWDETKDISDARERIEDLLVTTNYFPQKLTLVEVESQPIDEQELDRRNFNAVTSFGFENIECGLNQELPSTVQSLSQEQTGLLDIASVRRQHLSRRRLGRKLE